MAKIKKIKPLPLAQITGAIYGFLGLLVGGFMTVGAVAGLDVTQGEGDPNNIFYKAAVFIFPLLYAAMGFIGGLISAFLFNIAVNWIGPLEVEIEP